MTRVALVLSLLAASALGLATISVSSHAGRSAPKLSEPSAGEELRGDSSSSARRFRLRGLRDADRGGAPAFSHSTGANLASPAPVASTITVDRTDDAASASACTTAASDCSLRGAVQYANSNPGTTINIPAGTYNLSIVGGGTEGFSGNNAVGDLDITASNTTIVGAGADSTIIQQTTPNDRVIEVNPFLDGNFNFSISNVTIKGGKETTGVGGGGLISGSQGSNTTIANCIFTGNSATGAGTAGGGGASVLGGNLTVTNSTFTGNSTSASGGAIGYSAGDPFGRIPSSGTLTVSGSTFSGNSASSTAAGGGALDLFDFNRSTGTYQINSTSFSGNNAANGSGGAVLVESGPLTVRTSSLASNHAKNNGGAISADSSINVAYSRFVGNSADTPSRGNSVFGRGGQLSADDNWWGSSSGPSVNDVRIQGPNSTTSQQTLNSWLQLRHSANPSSICANQSSTLTADIKGRSSGGALTNELSGLPAFPVPGTNIFSNPQLGTISGASTQFVDGVATATYTAGSNYGTGSADASVDSQTPPVTAQISIDQNTTSDPADQAVCEGANASFTTTASGGGPFSFVWKRGSTVLANGGNISITSSGNTSTLNISNAQPADADTYTVETTGACSTDTKSATLTVNPSTSATALSDQTVCQGATANFSTAASGGQPFTYQWRLDGSSIAGANGSSVAIPTSSLSVGDHTVEVVVGGSCGSVTKSAKLTVQAGTSATNPADETVCQGASANFSTTASGTGPFTYAWTVDGSPAGSTASINVATGSLSTGNHTVSVTVGGACGSVTKNATLTVQENTSATNPADQTVCQGASANFSTTASGTGPFTYAWTVDGSPAGSTASINVATGSLSTGNHTVSVTVSGTCGSASRSATLTVQENTAATDLSGEIVCQGASASFSTTASGAGPFSYAWTVDGNAVGGDNASVSVATGSLGVGNHAVAVTVRGACGSVTKSTTLTVQEPTTATRPGDQTVCKGASATFSTTASGTGPFTYQWRLDGSNIAGANASSVSIPTSSLSDGNHSVEVLVGGECGSVTKSATLTVNSAPVVTANPADLSVVSGNATFSAAASGTPTPSVQWQVSTDGGASFSDIPGATSTTLGFAVNSSMNGYKYRAVFTNSCGTVMTTAATLTTCTPPTVTANPTSVADACVGQLITFSASAGGTPAPTVQWQVSSNGGGTFTDIPGATSNTLNVTASVAVRNNQYRAVFTNACGTDISTPATLGVDSIAPTITLSKTTTSLWPPDHKYRTINLSDFVAGASDNCNANLLGSVVIASVTSDEVEDNPSGGDGTTLNDIVIAPDCKSVQLRAERDGNLNGRVYTITFRVTDSAGNVGTATATVTVSKTLNSGTAVNDGPHYTVNGTCP